MSDENLCITPSRKKCKIYRSKLDHKNSGRKLTPCSNSESCQAVIIGYFRRHKTLISTGNTSPRRSSSKTICNNYSNISSIRFDDHSFRTQIAKDQRSNHCNDLSKIRDNPRSHHCVCGELNCLTTILKLNNLCWTSESSTLNITNVLNSSIDDDKYVAASLHRIISPSSNKNCSPTKNVSPNFKCVMPLTYSLVEEEQNSKPKMSLDNDHLAACPNLPSDTCASDTAPRQQTLSQKENITKRSCIIEKHCFIYHSSGDNVKPKTNAKEKCSRKIGRLDLGYSNAGSKKTLTEFFPVRRSIRKTRTVVQEEMNKSLERAIIEGREEYLQIKNFSGKGRGVIALRPFKRGEFVVEYVGELITMAEANQREKQYVLDGDAGCYMFYFKFRNQQHCIDATAESDKKGRLINHSRNGNLITKVIEVQNQPRLVLLAKDNIQPGDELSYDYGDRSRESLLHHPWLAL